MEIIKKETFDDVTVLSVISQLDTGTAPRCQIEIEKALKDTDKLVIDLSACPFVSSAGLRCFLVAAKGIKAKNGKFALSQPNEVVSDVLEISGFNNILMVTTSLDLAIEFVS